MRTHPFATRFVRVAVVVGAALSVLLTGVPAQASDGIFQGSNSGEANQNINANCSGVPNTLGLAAQTTNVQLSCTSGTCDASGTTTIPSLDPVQTFNWQALGLQVGVMGSVPFSGDNGISGSFNVNSFLELSDGLKRLVGTAFFSCPGGTGQMDYAGTHFPQVLEQQFNETISYSENFSRSETRRMGNIISNINIGDFFQKGQQLLGQSSEDGYKVMPLAGRGLRLQGQSAGDMGAWPWGIWGTYQHTDSEDDFVTTAFESDSDTVLFGADVSFWENVITGVALGFDATDVDTTFNAGEAEVDSFLVVPYFGIYMSDYLGVDFDVSADFKIGYANVDIDQFRTAAGARVTSSTDADRLFFSGNVNAGKSWGNFRLGGNAGWLVAREDLDGFTESDGTVVADTETQFGQLTVGGDASYLWGSFEPFARANYNFDYEREKVVVPGTTLQPANDNDEIVFGAGLRWFSNAGVTAAFEWNTVIGREDFDSDTYMLFIRGDF